MQNKMKTILQFHSRCWLILHFCCQVTWVTDTPWSLCSNTGRVSKPHSSGPAQLSCLGHLLPHVLPLSASPSRTKGSEGLREDTSQRRTKGSNCCYFFTWILPTPPITLTAKLTGLTFYCKLNKAAKIESVTLNGIKW